MAAPGQDSEVCIIDLKSKTVICTLQADEDFKKFGEFPS